MTLSEFNALMDDFKEEFGAKQFSNRICSKIWLVIRDISVQEFRFGIDRYFETSSKPPTVSAIRNACKDSIERANEKIKRDTFERMKQMAGGCKMCGLTGMMHAVSLVTR